MYGPNNFYSWPQGPQTMMPQNNSYPVFIPMPQTKSETENLLAILKAARKEQKKDGDKKPDDKKGDPKKPDVMSYLQKAAIAFAITPFVMLANWMVIMYIIKSAKGI